MQDGGRTERLTDEQLETLLEVVFIVCFADGEFGEEEQTRFRHRVRQLEDGRLRSDRVDGLMLQAAVKLSQEGRDARLRRAKDVLADDDAKRIALALAIDIAAADGLDEDERASVDAVAKAFAIERRDVDELLDAS